MSNQPFPVSHRAAATKLSSVAAIVAAAQLMREKGVNIIDMGAGEPDFATPESIKNSAKKALDENFTRYTPASGILPLRQAVCDRVAEDFGTRYQPDECCITVGGKQ